MTRLVFPKPKPRKKKRRTRGAVFHRQVLAADGDKCANRFCVSVQKRVVNSLHAHHIIYRSRCGKDKPKNGIALCPICHDRVHNGYSSNGTRVSGRQYMISILEQHEDSPGFRWGEALEILRRKEPVEGNHSGRRSTCPEPKCRLG